MTTEQSLTAEAGNMTDTTKRPTLTREQIEEVRLFARGTRDYIPAELALGRGIWWVVEQLCDHVLAIPAQSEPTFAQGIEAAANVCEEEADKFRGADGKTTVSALRGGMITCRDRIRALSPAEPGLVSVAFEAKKLLDDICVVVDETPEAALAMFPRGLIARVRKHLLAAAKPGSER